MNGYANLIAARLRKLAETAGTGMLPVSGSGDGAFFLRGGHVVHAESSHTSPRHPVGLAALGLGAAQAGPAPYSEQSAGEQLGGARASGAELVPVRSVGKVAGLLAVTELTIDAATELLSSESRYAKFRQFDVPFQAHVRPIPVAVLLTEVERRHHVLRQLAEVITVDTRVVRNALPGWPRLQVSRSQWALVMGIGDGRTPRSLAMELGRSVFATTIEIYRLITLGLLAVPGKPAAGAARPGEVMSFTRAIHNGRGNDA
ncbi:MAG: hypothetical protein JWM19_7809 [Actinomycetia bacterium]|nr:hypothetical protein [Actinomycetes bacterium]